MDLQNGCISDYHCIEIQISYEIEHHAFGIFNREMLWHCKELFLFLSFSCIIGLMILVPSSTIVINVMQKTSDISIDQSGPDVFHKNRDFGLTVRHARFKRHLVESTNDWCHLLLNVCEVSSVLLSSTCIGLPNLNVLPSFSCVGPPSCSVCGNGDFQCDVLWHFDRPLLPIRTSTSKLPESTAYLQFAMQFVF